ncbi:MAG: sugar phosphate isomerase/epimerase [Coriobacteriales bacterium]|nr:sugar phosphate isomerase/epimerase [Actinomycetes bacterium]
MEPVLATYHGADACESRTLELAREDGFSGIEVTVNSHVSRASVSMRPLLSSSECGCPVRYHFALGDLELSSREAGVARDALAAMKSAVRMIADAGGDYLTVHAALPADSYGTSRFEATVERLGELREFAQEHGVLLGLENLRWGATCDPDIFLELVDRSGVAVTLDVGHAISSEFSGAGYSAEGFIARCGSRVRSAHVYGREEGRHHPPADLGAIRPALDALVGLGCGWWTIELPDPAEARATRRMLTSYLAQSGGVSVGGLRS